MARMNPANEQLWLHLLSQQEWVTVNDLVSTYPEITGWIGPPGEVRIVLDQFVKGSMAISRLKAGQFQYAVSMSCRPPLGTVLRDIYRSAPVKGIAA